MEKITFRELKADEIELRVGTTKDKDFSLLLYKTARVDANVLDESVGCYNWQKKFYQVKNTMICSVGIYFENRKEWVWKDDAGDESNQDAVKGEASDSFKRAGFAWGIGRALYTSPFIWIKGDDNNNAKFSRYSVKEIDYTNGTITKLVITNDRTKEVVFSYGSSEKVAKNNVSVAKNIIADTQPQPKKPIGELEMRYLQDHVGSLDQVNYKKFFDALLLRYGVRSIVELTETQGKELVGKLQAR